MKQDRRQRWWIMSTDAKCSGLLNKEQIEKESQRVDG